MSAQVREGVTPSEAHVPRAVSMPFGLNVAEALAAFVAAILVIGVVAFYFTSLSPEQDRLRALQAELDEQRRNIVAVQTPGTREQASAADVAREAVESLDSFKTSHLRPFSTGRIDLIKEINALTRKNSVTLTSGIDMGGGPPEAGTEGDQAIEKPRGKKGTTSRKKSDELGTAFPSVSFRFTVFGQYANLRTLIQELEREKHFLVINSINLANQEAKVAGRRSRGGGGEAGGMSGIMLTIEMAAYFRPVG